MNALLKFVRLVVEGDHPESTLLGLWNVRKWELVKTLERLAWDVERVVKLAHVLGRDISSHPQIAGLETAAAEQRAELLRLDRFLTETATAPTGILRSQEVTVRVCTAWLVLEWAIQPESRGILADLRDKLVLRAEQEEIDLRGLGI